MSNLSLNIQSTSLQRQELDIPHVRHATSVVSFVNQMMEQALKLNASDVHLECYSNNARLRYRLDGVLKEVKTNAFLLANFSSVATRIKVLASLDISDSRSAQDGGFHVAYTTGKADIRVSILPAVTGERIALRILPEAGKLFNFEELGMSVEQAQQLKAALSASQGGILVSGPTGSGKTTSLYTMIQKLDHKSMNILTIENPVERRLYGIGQVQVNESNGLGFSQALRTFLRQDPEVILLGEIRDGETATVAMKAAMTGHLVLSTVHANSNLGTVLRLMGLGVDLSTICNATNLIIAQRLLRLICPYCKMEDKDNRAQAKEAMAVLGLTLSALSLGRGCKECAYTGFLGRSGVFEMLKVDPSAPIQAALNGHVEQLHPWVLGYDLITACAKLLLEQKISFDEYYRIVGGMAGR